MTENDKHTTYKHGDDWGMVYDCLNHIRQDYKPVKRGVTFVQAGLRILDSGSGNSLLIHNVDGSRHFAPLFKWLKMRIFELKYLVFFSLFDG